MEKDYGYIDGNPGFSWPLIPAPVRKGYGWVGRPTDWELDLIEGYGG
jgi:hypothetical protein